MEIKVLDLRSSTRPALLRKPNVFNVPLVESRGFRMADFE